MNQEERDALCESLKSWKPKQHVEIRVDKLLRLLETLSESLALIQVQGQVLYRLQKTADESETPSPLPLCEVEGAKS